MKICYICECCEELISIATLRDSDLTNDDAVGIMNSPLNVVYMETLCEDCKAALGLSDRLGYVEFSGVNIIH